MVPLLDLFLKLWIPIFYSAGDELAFLIFVVNNEKIHPLVNLMDIVFDELLEDLEGRISRASLVVRLNPQLPDHGLASLKEGPQDSVLGVREFHIVDMLFVILHVLDHVQEEGLVVDLAPVFPHHHAWVLDRAIPVLLRLLDFALSFAPELPLDMAVVGVLQLDAAELIDEVLIVPIDAGGHGQLQVVDDVIYGLLEVIEVVHDLAPVPLHSLLHSLQALLLIRKQVDDLVARVAARLCSHPRLARPQGCLGERLNRLPGAQMRRGSRAALILGQLIFLFGPG